MKYINNELIKLNNYLKNRKVAIIGLGVINVPLIDYMHKVGAKVTVFDHRSIEDIPKDTVKKITDYAMEFSFGSNNLSK